MGHFNQRLLPKVHFLFRRTPISPTDNEKYLGGCINVEYETGEKIHYNFTHCTTPGLQLETAVSRLTTEGIKQHLTHGFLAEDLCVLHWHALHCMMLYLLIYI